MFSRALARASRRTTTTTSSAIDRAFGTWMGAEQEELAYAPTKKVRGTRERGTRARRREKDENERLVTEDEMKTLTMRMCATTR